MSTETTSAPSDVERIKQESRFLRGSIADGLINQRTGSISEDDQQLTKFHGIYQQDDRDLRIERQNQKLEPAFQFMIRARVPAGICDAKQWLGMADISEKYADGSLRLTTRQAFQLHGVIKRDLKKTMQGINNSLLDTIAACGDVNRNVMATPNRFRSDVHAQVAADAEAVSEHLLPRTNAYHEIWLDGEKVTTEESEPIYGALYLPRKFKIAFAIPPENDVDVLAHDLGFIAIVESGELIGYNVTVGGGMGATHGRDDTYPRLADVIGFCGADEVLDVTEKVVMIQRDFGNRSDRKRARLKYTIDDRNIEWFVEELASRRGKPLGEVRGYRFRRHSDPLGWVEGEDGRWHRTVFVENGRLREDQLVAVNEIARQLGPDFILTPNQNLIIANIATDEKQRVDDLLSASAPSTIREPSDLRRSAMACVALPSCPLAMAEAERYLPDFVTRMEELFTRHGKPATDTVVRITGCPNGCARPYVAEIGLVGKSPNRYNLHLGGDGQGERLNQLYRENLSEQEILKEIDGLAAQWVAAAPDKRFGDFVDGLLFKEAS